MIERKKKHCDGPCDSDQFIWKNHGGKKYCKYCWMIVEKELTSTTVNDKPTKQYRIPSRSPKRVREEAAYSALRKVFLDQHPMCQMAIRDICTHKATEIQHKKGRGIYYLDTTTWMSGCHNCHAYATDHPEEAIKNGWAELKLTPKNKEQ